MLETIELQQGNKDGDKNGFSNNKRNKQPKELKK